MDGEAKIPSSPDAIPENRSRRRQTSYDARAMQRMRQTFVEPQDPDMMGSLVRRKKVVSVPLGASGGDFFGPPVGSAVANAPASSPHVSPGANRPKRTSNMSFGALIRRKQVSLDLYAGHEADFFADVDATEAQPMLPAPEETETETEQPFSKSADGVEKVKEEPIAENIVDESEIFFPLKFSPRVKIGAAARGQGGHGGHGHAPTPPTAEIGHQTALDEELRNAIEVQNTRNRELKTQIEMLMDRLEGETDQEQEKLFEDIRETQTQIEKCAVAVKSKLHPEDVSDSVNKGDVKESTDDFCDDEDDGIIRATRLDYIWTAVLVLVMIAFTCVIVFWETHLDESSATFGPVGLACKTPCSGDTVSQDYFFGHSHFEDGQYIQLIMQLDPNIHHEVGAVAYIVGAETGHVKAEVAFGPPAEDEITHFQEKIKVDFEHPHEDHIINVESTDPDVVITYKLHASVLSHLAGKSELIAALIMIFVYLFILLEVIHRTLVAIFGSVVALFFFFLIHMGETESISTLMLHMEWSTLGLLFGMMLIVGELSHTGVFEWFAVRLLIASKGSYNRLMVLLSLLTAVSSAFLDNVTTMLLIAPVTIDMCNILDVDPRPYLIGEVLLSNVGGTATLIGDPPNIIIGSAFEEIGFVDFIVNVLPCIFFFCIPVSVGLILYIYRYYLSTTKMPVLDEAKLIRTYRIYDEPRLYIAGTVAFFVILIFFLHPVHHKDTAWIALLGAFITMTFTNPHDVQDALRNHIEWDTLLFFAGLFVLVEVCAALGLLAAIGSALAKFIEAQDEDKQLTVAITLLLWVSAITSAFLDNIPYTATMIPVIRILADELPDTLPVTTLAWALSFGACLGGNGTLLGASANIVTAGISTNKGFEVSFVNFLYPGMLVMVSTVAIANIYMLVVFVWI